MELLWANEDFQGSQQAANEALSWGMSLGEVKGECGRSPQEDTSKVAYPNSVPHSQPLRVKSNLQSATK